MAIAPWAARGAFGGGLLDPFFGGAGGDLGALMAPFGGGAGAIQTMPPMDVHETEKTYEIRADAPGMNPEVSHGLTAAVVPTCAQAHINPLWPSIRGPTSRLIAVALF